MARLSYLGLLLVAAAGCQVFSPNHRKAPTPPAEAGPAQSVAEPARALLPCTHTQTAKPVEAVEPVEPFEPVRQFKKVELTEPEPDPVLDDALSQAADCLERGDDEGAAEHLRKHVAANPDQFVFRAQLAEVLARLDRLAEAQGHLEAAIAHAQDGPPAARTRTVRYHTRLMEIARLRGDEYAEHLHRGIGLFLVAERLVAEEADAGDVERLRCKAATALKGAQFRRPDDARPAWYLYRVWARLEQPRPAERALRQAVAAAPFSDLTPAESRDLALAAAPETTLK